MIAPQASLARRERNVYFLLDSVSFFLLSTAFFQEAGAGGLEPSSLLICFGE